MFLECTPRAKHSTLLLAAASIAVLTTAPALAGSVAGPTPPPHSGKTGSASYLTRTFVPGPAVSHGNQAAFQLTRDDFLRLFAYGREIQISVSPDGGLYQMDIGFADLVTAQAWQMPDIPFDSPSTWAIMDPAATPHAALYPTATHAIVSTDDQFAEGTVYVYYRFGETQLVMLGETAEPPDSQPLEHIRYDFPMALFPLDSNLAISAELDQNYEGIPARQTHVVEMHGFGTLQLNDQESLDVGAFIDDIVYRDLAETNPDILLDFETGYSLFASDGTFVSFYIADPPSGDSTAINGDVYMEHVQIWRVGEAGTIDLASETPQETTGWTVYPNPATSEIRFSQPVTVALYDMLGRRVATGESVQHLSVSGMPPGLYLVRSDTGKSRTLIIQ